MPVTLFGKKYTFTQFDGSPLDVVVWSNQNHAVSRPTASSRWSGRNDGDAGDLCAAGTTATFGDTAQPGSRWWDGTSFGPADLADRGGRQRDDLQGMK